VTRANKGRALTSIKAINDPFITPVRAFTPLVSAVRIPCYHSFRGKKHVSGWVYGVKERHSAVRAAKLLVRMMRAVTDAFTSPLPKRTHTLPNLQDYFKYMFQYDTVRSSTRSTAVASLLSSDINRPGPSLLWRSLMHPNTPI